MKNNREIVIQVIGCPGAGKSTVSQIIMNALGRSGIESVSIESDGGLDKDSYAEPDFHSRRVLSLSKDLKVVIKQVSSRSIGTKGTKVIGGIGGGR